MRGLLKPLQFGVKSKIFGFLILVCLAFPPPSADVNANVLNPKSDTFESPSAFQAQPGDGFSHDRSPDRGIADEFWDDRFPGKGFSESPLTLLAHGDDIYAGGTFQLVDGVFVNGIAKWDGAHTTALGGGVDGCLGTDCIPTVNAIAAHGADVFVGGNFTQADNELANFVAKWDGTAWSPLGDGFDAPVSALMFVGDTLVAGGEFLHSGDTTLNYAARWDGSAWHPLDEGLDAPVRVFAVDGTNLYVGGEFIQAGALTVNHIALWNGTNWSALGGGLGATIRYLAIASDNLFAAPGQYTDPVCLAQWDGSTWKDNDLCWVDWMGRGATWITALGTWQGDVYASRYNSYPGTNYVHDEWYRLEDTGWTLVAEDGFNFPALGMTSNDKQLFFISRCTIGCPDPEEYVKGWNGSTWSNLFVGANNDTPHFEAMAAAPGGLYIGGSFTHIGDKPIEGVAFWNGQEWTPVGSGIKGTVRALAVSGDKLYAGGLFWQAGGILVNNIAMWDGQTWTALGQGVEYQVYALATVGKNLYVGGHFRHAGGISANYIARWDGSKWHPLGEGTNKRVWQIVANKTDVYVRGDFKTAGGREISHLARWDGSKWHPVMDDPPSSLTIALNGKNLYIGSRNTLRRWNGFKWSEWTLSGQSYIAALAFRGNDLIISGHLETSAHGVLNVARWRGGNLEPLGSGTNGYIYLLSAGSQDIYVRGYFTLAGGKPSGGFGIWHDPAPQTPRLVTPQNNDSVKKKSVWLHWNPPAGASRYQLQLKRNTKKGKLLLDTATDGTEYRTPELRRGTTYVWRLRACSTISSSEYCSSWTKWRRFSIKEQWR